MKETYREQNLFAKIEKTTNSRCSNPHGEDNQYRSILQESSDFQMSVSSEREIPIRDNFSIVPALYTVPKAHVIVGRWIILR